MYVIVIISATIRGYDDRVVVVRSNGSALFSILSRVLLAVALLHRHYTITHTIDLYIMI